MLVYMESCHSFRLLCSAKELRLSSKRASLIKQVPLAIILARHLAIGNPLHAAHTDDLAQVWLKWDGLLGVHHFVTQSAKRFISSGVLSPFIVLALRLITWMLSGVYPLELSIRSNEAAFIPPVSNGSPKTGQPCGIIISSGVIVNSIPTFFALNRAFLHKPLSGCLSLYFL